RPVHAERTSGLPPAQGAGPMPRGVSAQTGEDGEAPVSRLTGASPRGVSDGARTRDTQDHNLVLYQLSYTHHVVAAGERCRGWTTDRIPERVTPRTRPVPRRRRCSRLRRWARRRG